MEVLITLLFIGAFIYFLFRGLNLLIYINKKNTKLLAEMGGLLVTFDKLAKILKSKGYLPDKDDFNRGSLFSRLFSSRLAFISQLQEQKILISHIQLISIMKLKLLENRQLVQIKFI